MADVKLKVKVRDTNGVIFEGEADRVSSFNEVGPFDIYQMHANFISIIQNQLTLYNNKQKVKELQFEKAVLKVKKDLVHIFLGIEVLSLEDGPLEDKSKQPPEKKA